VEEAVKIGLIAISAAIAIGVPALATALAQSRIGAAMAGAVAERPELVGSAIIMVAIPETMVILGLVIAFMITTLKSAK
jgi:V/A-type H+-transporting ATPase subunit K